MAAGTGFEPMPTQSKCVVLPIRRTRHINFTMVWVANLNISLSMKLFSLKSHSKIEMGKIKSCYDFVYDFHLHGIAFANLVTILSMMSNKTGFPTPVRSTSLYILDPQ